MGAPFTGRRGSQDQLAEGGGWGDRKRRALRCDARATPYVVHLRSPTSMYLCQSAVRVSHPLL